MTPPRQLVPAEVIERKIYLVRGHRVMLDRDLAKLYRVAARSLNQAIKRNAARFPDDFLFQLTWPETRGLLRSQIVILERGHHAKYRPYAFTEQGVAMLSSVLRSRRAIQVNIAIMRTFVRLRRMLATHEELARRLGELERTCDKHDKQFRAVFDAIRDLMTPRLPPRRSIGFRTHTH
ncbi:MAG: ORF6N domain-containing protein [Acidobacteria bacterium]|nr:ORF6N domain-containing protein [Acidobacteriota bacterium]MBI3263042.1 ORF6N domain-containing protein [Acidobacteriota bacterium]